MAKNTLKTQKPTIIKTSRGDIQITKTTKKRIKRGAIGFLLGTLGFVLIFIAAGNEDNREAMGPERAKKELLSERTSLLMGATGFAAIIGALALTKDKKTR